MLRASCFRLRAYFRCLDVSGDSNDDNDDDDDAPTVLLLLFLLMLMLFLRSRIQILPYRMFPTLQRGRYPEAGPAPTRTRLKSVPQPMFGTCGLWTRESNNDASADGAAQRCTRNDFSRLVQCLISQRAPRPIKRKMFLVFTHESFFLLAGCMSLDVKARAKGCWQLPIRKRTREQKPK